MAFVLLEKQERGAIGLLPKDISIGKSGVGFGALISEDFLRDNTKVEVYFDKENGKVGFKPSNSPKGFATRKEGVRVLSSVKLSNYVKVGRYSASKESNMWIIKVPEIALK